MLTLKRLVKYNFSIMANSLNEKQERFCEFYAEYLNATRAAIHAGYSEKTAYSIGHELLKKLEIRERVSFYSEKLRDRVHVSAERVIQELARIAFARPEDAMSWVDGCLTFENSENLSPDVTAAIARITITPTKHGIKQEIVFHDKNSALEKLSKHLGLLVDRSEVNNTHVFKGEISPEDEKAFLRFAQNFIHNEPDLPVLEHEPEHEPAAIDDYSDMV